MGILYSRNDQFENVVQEQEAEREIISCDANKIPDRKSSNNSECDQYLASGNNFNHWKNPDLFHDDSLQNENSEPNAKPYTTFESLISKDFLNKLMIKFPRGHICLNEVETKEYLAELNRLNHLTNPETNFQAFLHEFIKSENPLKMRFSKNLPKDKYDLVKHRVLSGKEVQHWKTYFQNRKDQLLRRSSISLTSFGVEDSEEFEDDELEGDVDTDTTCSNDSDEYSKVEDSDVPEKIEDDKFEGDVDTDTTF